MDKSMVRVLFLITLTISCIFAVHLADASNSEWVEKAPMPTGRYNFGAAVVNGTIYAIGGITNIPERKSGHITTTINVNEAYDPTNDVWVEKTAMPAPHWLDSYGISVSQNRIYCIGGPANNVYDPATDQWEAKTPMPTSRQWLTANVVDDKIYLIGGLAFGPAPAWQGSTSINSLFRTTAYSQSSMNEVYDPVTDSWSERSPIPHAVDSYASAVVDNKIYVMGGRIGGDVVGFVQVYDPQTDEWSQAASVPIPVEAAAAGVMTISNEKAVCVVGGSTTFAGCDATNLNQIYFPENNSWTTGPQIIAKVASLSVAVANDKLYAMGGFGYYGYTGTTYQYTSAANLETNSTTSLPQSSSPPNENQNNPIITTEISIAAATLLGTVTVAAASRNHTVEEKNQNIIHKTQKSL